MAAPFTVAYQHTESITPRNIVSSVATPDIVGSMSVASESGLGSYVRRRRESLHITLTELARRAGLSKSELSSLENGRIALPGADKRRRLAAALHVRHVDLLVAAGEIASDEVERTPEPEPGDPLTRLAPLIYSIQWDETMYTAIRGMIREIAKMQRENATDETIQISGPPELSPEPHLLPRTSERTLLRQDR